jgi:hypothetical protein
MPSKPIEPPAEMVAEIGARLGRICQSYTVEEFDTLVRQIALVRMKYDALRDETFFFAPRIVDGGYYVRSQPPGDDRIAEPRS